MNILEGANLLETACECLCAEFKAPAVTGVMDGGLESKKEV